MNTIETATIIQSELDKAAVEQATSGWMEVNEKLVKYTGGAEVKIPSLDMDGMADYDRTNGFVQGSVNFQYETKKMTQDRGRSFSFDENDVDETNFVLTASTVMGEFQITKVVPEIDAYRYSTIAAACIKKGKASGGYTADEATILQKLYYDIAAVQAIVGQNTPLVITIDSMVAAILSMSEMEVHILKFIMQTMEQLRQVLKSMESPVLIMDTGFIRAMCTQFRHRWC